MLSTCSFPPILLASAAVVIISLIIIFSSLPNNSSFPCIQLSLLIFIGRVSMAFRVTKQLMAAPTRKDTHPALRKLYSKYFYENGMVTRHLSPFEQDVLGPWLKAMPQKVRSFEYCVIFSTQVVDWLVRTWHTDSNAACSFPYMNHSLQGELNCRAHTLFSLLGPFISQQNGVKKDMTT